MKAAANVIAVLAWGGLLAAMWYPLVAGMPPFGLWLGVVVASFLVGLVIPMFLLGLEKEKIEPAPRGKVGGGGHQWRTRTTTRTERPAAGPKREE